MPSKINTVKRFELVIRKQRRVSYLYAKEVTNKLQANKQGSSLTRLVQHLIKIEQNDYELIRDNNMLGELRMILPKLVWITAT